MKRFTDAHKWQDAWFRQLTPSAKVLWLFLLDRVDAAGVWERDDQLFQFLSGCPQEVESLLLELADRVKALDGGKVLVPKFVNYQQGKRLSGESPPHRQILRLLDKHGLQQAESGLVTLALPQAKGSDRVAKDKANGSPSKSEGLENPLGNSKGKGKGIKEGGTGETIPQELDHPSFHEAWENYLQLRRQNRWGKFKATTLAAKFKEFTAWGLAATVLALQTSVKQGWRGVFLQNQGAAAGQDTDQDYENAADL